MSPSAFSLRPSGQPCPVIRERRTRKGLRVVERSNPAIQRPTRYPDRHVLTRFAPAPTGHLHLGHVVNALRVWGAARDRDGRVLLRIEDHDRQRSRPEFEASIVEDLAWLGFVHDGPIVRQSERDALYRKALQPLIDRELVYGCTCTRAEIGRAAGIGDPESGEHRYLNTCRDKEIELTDAVGWR